MEYFIQIIKEKKGNFWGTRLDENDCLCTSHPSMETAANANCSNITSVLWKSRMETQLVTIAAVSSYAKINDLEAQRWSQREDAKRFLSSHLHQSAKSESFAVRDVRCTYPSSNCFFISHLGCEHFFSFLPAAASFCCVSLQFHPPTPLFLCFERHSTLASRRAPECSVALPCII